MANVGKPRKYKSVEQMQALIDDYFVDCIKKGEPFTVTGLALALNMTRQGLLDYQDRPDFADTVKKAKARVEQQIELGMLTGKLNTIGAIFNAKNNFGWRDKQDIELNANVSLCMEKALESME